MCIFIYIELYFSNALKKFYEIIFKGVLYFL